METMTQVGTWLPIFSGFYGTIWESDHLEEMELEYINGERKLKGLDPVTWDDVEWDYDRYCKQVSEDVTHEIGCLLTNLNLISGWNFQKLNSPREYNFSNDSIDVEFSLSDENKSAIAKYLQEHKKEFSAYLKATYTSRSGFISSYENDLEAWLDLDETLNHKHKLGAVFNFILRNEHGQDLEMTIYDNVETNISASNYDTLTGDK